MPYKIHGKEMGGKEAAGTLFGEMGGRVTGVHERLKRAREAAKARREHYKQSKKRTKKRRIKKASQASINRRMAKVRAAKKHKRR